MMLLVFACKQRDQSNADAGNTKPAAQHSTTISSAFGNDNIEKIVYAPFPPPFIRGEYETQTPLLLDSLYNRWTDDKANIDSLIHHFPAILLDTFPQSITTSCCGGSRFIFFSSKAVYAVHWDNLNENVIYMNHRFCITSPFDLDDLKKYLNRKVVAKEAIVETASDTILTDDVNKELSYRRSFYTNSAEKETIIRYILK